MIHIKPAILFIIILGLSYIITDNYIPLSQNGFSRILKKFSAVFFTYISFDAISTTSEESKIHNAISPEEMGYALLIYTIIHVTVTLVITGIMSTTKNSVMLQTL